MEKKFNKNLWLVSANADKERGILTQSEIDYACETWVNSFAGKTVAEIKSEQIESTITEREEWFI